MSKDITYCGYDHCRDTSCERHASHATGYNNSFTYFDDCPTHQLALDELRSVISDIED